MAPTFCADGALAMVAACIASVFCHKYDALMLGLCLHCSRSRPHRAHVCVACMQTFATPVHPGHRAARCRDLLSRGVFSAVARSGVLHLRAPPPTTAAAAELHAALATLRAAALRAVLAVAVQLTGNSGAMHELARLLAASEDGCLGDRAGDILKAAQPPSAP